jgi:inositol-phosphate transport system permease protein
VQEVAARLIAVAAEPRPNYPARRSFLAGLIVLHAFTTVTLIIAIFIILHFLGLYDSPGGVILVKAALERPFGVRVMKGFHDNVPWELEMAGMQDGASRLRVWADIVLPLVLAPGGGAPVLAT